MTGSSKVALVVRMLVAVRRRKTTRPARKIAAHARQGRGPIFAGRWVIEILVSSPIAIDRGSP
jgi:hypothetical protein